MCTSLQPLILKPQPVPNPTREASVEPRAEKLETPGSCCKSLQTSELAGATMHEDLLLGRTDMPFRFAAAWKNVEELDGGSDFGRVGTIPQEFKN